MLDLVCCQGFTLSTLFKSCMCFTSSDQPDIPEKRHVAFTRLPDGTNFKYLFDNSNIKHSVNLVFNNDHVIITAHTENSKLFNQKSIKLVGCKLENLVQYIPTGIVDMIKIMLVSIKNTGSMKGCIIHIDGVTYLCCGFPIIAPDNSVISVLLMKKEFDEGLIMANEIIGNVPLHKPEEKEISNFLIEPHS